MSKSRIAVLIPAYKLDFIEATLTGLCHQTFKDFDVFISDDSANEKISQEITKWQSSGLFSNLNLELVIGPKNAFLNHHHLDQRYSPDYEFIHFLMDDDYIYPTFYEQHLAAHMQNDFCASVSQRWLSNEENIPVGRMPDIGFLTNNIGHFTELDARSLSVMTLPHCYNWLGELSNMLLRPEGKLLFEKPPIAADKLNYHGLMDIGTCLRLAQRKPLVFISSFHSNFRQHPNQTTHIHGTWGSRFTRLSWASFALASHSRGLLSDQQLQENWSQFRKLLLAEIPYDQKLIQPLEIIDYPHTSLQSKIEHLSEYLFDFYKTNPSLNKITTR